MQLSRKVNPKYADLLDAYLDTLVEEGLISTTAEYRPKVETAYEICLQTFVDGEIHDEIGFLVYHTRANQEISFLGGEDKVEYGNFVINKIIQFLNFIDPINNATLNFEKLGAIKHGS